MTDEKTKEILKHTFNELNRVVKKRQGNGSSGFSQKRELMWTRKNSEARESEAEAPED